MTDEPLAVVAAFGAACNAHDLDAALGKDGLSRLLS